MNALRQRLGDRARFGAPLAPRTTWGVGGPAWCLCRVHSATEAAWVRREASRHGVACRVLGRGSNLLVADAGFAGVLLSLKGDLAKVKVLEDGLLAGAGAHLPALVKLAARRGLAGLEWAAGIPASLGGAVAMNAGAAGGSVSAILAEVELLLANGGQFLAGPRDLKPGYRRGGLPRGAMVLGARLRLTPDDPGAVAARTRAVLERRMASQPLTAATAGSVFKNPAGDFAGRLIEVAGCKGWRVGGAVVSFRHANFIENAGGATAAQVLALIERVRRQVRQTSGVDLEPEVEVLGDV